MAFPTFQIKLIILRANAHVFLSTLPQFYLSYTIWIILTTAKVYIYIYTIALFYENEGE